MKKILCVIDVQNDFIDGVLGTEEAQETIPNIVNKIKNESWDLICVTLDTHGMDYFETREGRKLGVMHCVKNTDGWLINKEVKEALYDANEIRNIEVAYIEKPTFGTDELPLIIHHLMPFDEELDIEFVGFCTDICVVSNVLITKAAFWNRANIIVDSSCCAGTNPENHKFALNTMVSCQIEVL